MNLDIPNTISSNTANYATLRWFFWTGYPAALHANGGTRCLRCREPWPCPSVRKWSL